MYSVLNTLTLILLEFSLILIVFSDPDNDLCTDLTIDAAVLADGYQGYIFKGDYYWRIDIDSGIISDYGEKISYLFPNLPTPINAAFLVEEKIHRKSTVFISGDKWYYYKGSKQLKSGNTSQWKNFPPKPVDAAFTHINMWSDFQEHDVYIFFGNEFIIYNFHSVESPTFIAKNKAATAGRFLYFMYNHTAYSDTNIQDILDLRAGVTDKKWIVLFGDQEFCKANSSLKQPLCKQESPSGYFKCPRKLRPIVETEAPETTPPLIEITNSLPEQSDRTDLTDLTDDSESTTELSPVESEHKKGSSEKSSSTFLILFIIFFVIVLIAVVVIVVVFVVIKSRGKKEEQKLRKQSNETLSYDAESPETSDHMEDRKSRSGADSGSYIGRHKSQISERSQLSLDIGENEDNQNVSRSKRSETTKGVFEMRRNTKSRTDSESSIGSSKSRSSIKSDRKEEDENDDDLNELRSKSNETIRPQKPRSRKQSESSVRRSKSQRSIRSDRIEKDEKGEKGEKGENDEKEKKEKKKEKDEKEEKEKKERGEKDEKEKKKEKYEKDKTDSEDDLSPKDTDLSPKSSPKED